MKSFLLCGIMLLATMISAGCGDDNGNGNGNGNDGPTPILTVSTDALCLGAEAGASATFTVTASGTWSAVLSGAGFALDRTEGTGDATLRVTASAANTVAEKVSLGEIALTSPDVASPRTVLISQQPASPGPAPVELTITVDFAEGPSIATPALPASSAEALSGRHEYTIAGYPFAIHADAADKGKFFWTDNSQYYPMEEPYKGLYFSKTGAYVEFPAFEDKALTEIVYVFNNGAGELPALDWTTPDDDFVAYSTENADDGTGMTYTLLEPVAGIAYRLTVLDRGNAQVSKFVLTYR